MAKSRKRKSTLSQDGWEVDYAHGRSIVLHHPLFARLMAAVHEHTTEQKNECPKAGWVLAKSTGRLHICHGRRGSSEQWAYVLAHALLHFAFGHFVEKPNPKAWAAACDIFITRFLHDLKFGRPPDEFRPKGDLPAQSEHKLYERFCHEGIPADYLNYGTAGPFVCDFTGTEKAVDWRDQPIDWTRKFAAGLSESVTSAVNVAGGLEDYVGQARNENSVTNAQLARRWFVNSYPLLGALAASFRIIEDPVVCSRLNVSIAAINAEAKEIYINRNADLDEQQCRFVMAHEFLHIGLRHDTRCEGRDPYLWNIACDYVINGWLQEMRIGVPPPGLCLDPELKGLSAESVYDRIVTDLRRFKKLRTLRGNTGDLGDIMDHHPSWQHGGGVTLDEFYRQCLAQGLSYHQAGGRGLLPAELVEEINALSQPPIPWDVQLAQWFDHYFPPIEKVHTYARPSRRQSSTPDIPRPRYHKAGREEDGRTFGVILDTSGSMDRTTLAKALGAIASYSVSREVPLARLVFCDAYPYDEGYVAPDSISDRVRVKGRGGTELQPGIDLLDRAEDFPPDGPILIITDGECDKLSIKREHAFLMPQGRFLPFVPRGPVFRID